MTRVTARVLAASVRSGDSGLAFQATDPDQLDAHYDLAGILASEGKLDAAAAHYREVLRISPEHAEAAAALARVRSRLAPLSAGER